MRTPVVRLQRDVDQRGWVVRAQIHLPHIFHASKILVIDGWILSPHWYLRWAVARVWAEVLALADEAEMARDLWDERLPSGHYVACGSLGCEVTRCGFSR